jgi:hypothetical protein
MSRRLGPLVLATVFGAFVASTALAGSSGSTCQRHSGKTLLQDREARVYVAGQVRGGERRATNGVLDKIAGCIQRNGRRVLVGYRENRASDPFGDDYFGGAGLALRGHFVAIDQGEGHKYGGITADYQVRNLLTGRLVHRWRAGELGKADERVVGGAVSATGGMVWIANCTIYKSDRRVDAQVVGTIGGTCDSGPVATSLRENRGVVTWRSDGRTHRTTLR